MLHKCGLCYNQGRGAYFWKTLHCKGRALKLLLLDKLLLEAKCRFHAHNLQQGWGCTRSSGPQHMFSAGSGFCCNKA